ncbi:MAG: NADP-dependent isocitrate dehydrogenase, partial [Candidatus Aureabacteria bacterium]|nr:NADP-dependent isocitrate dehydrogenase [Candidatus Auribacterota bacterium]
MEKITIKNNTINVPANPVIPFIEGDGTGPDIWKAASFVIDSAVKKVSGGSKKIEWKEIYAGEKAYNKVGDWLPEDTLKAIKEYTVAI